MSAPETTPAERHMGDTCEHGIRYPHHCDECLGRDIPPGKSLSDHPCWGLPLNPTGMAHRGSDYSGDPHCARCGTLIEGPNRRQVDGSPLSWEPRKPTPRAATPTALPSAEDALREAVEPFADYHGDLPDYDHPLRCVFESGVQYTVDLLAKELGVEDYTPCDGTEEFDGDLGGTMMNIVRASLPTDEYGEHLWPSEVHAALQSPRASDEVLAAQAETYRHMHEIAAELGYPSILEALEAAPAASPVPVDASGALRGAIEEALGQISGGLCYFTAEAKHAQLVDAQRTLEGALDMIDLAGGPHTAPVADAQAKEETKP